MHTDAHAAELSRAVSARAFTVGSDIFFAAGEYSPGTPHGNELIAHELAHVVQQRGAPPSSAAASSRSRAMRSSTRPRPPRGDSDGAGVAAAAELSGGWFAFLDERLRSAVLAAAAADNDPNDALRGLYISDEQALALADDLGATGVDRQLAAAVARLDLDALDAAVLTVCAAPELATAGCSPTSRMT